MRMNIHKFNSKPKTIKWSPLQEARKVNPMTWEFFCQEDIKLKPKEVKQIQLGLGYMMSEGVVLVGLANSLKFDWCSLQNEINLEDAENIVITLTNNSNKIVDIKEHDLLCRVCYKKV